MGEKELKAKRWYCEGMIVAGLNGSPYDTITVHIYATTSTNAAIELRRTVIRKLYGTAKGRMVLRSAPYAIPIMVEATATSWEDLGGVPCIVVDIMAPYGMSFNEDVLHYVMPITKEYISQTLGEAWDERELPEPDTDTVDGKYLVRYEFEGELYDGDYPYSHFHRLFYAYDNDHATDRVKELAIYGCARTSHQIDWLRRVTVGDSKGSPAIKGVLRQAGVGDAGAPLTLWLTRSDVEDTLGDMIYQLLGEEDVYSEEGNDANVCKDEISAELTDDPVNHPSHYTSGGIECIDAIRASMSRDEFYGYLKGNTMKYIWRYEHKGKPEEDLRKALWYLGKLADLIEEDMHDETHSS